MVACQPRRSDGQWSRSYVRGEGIGDAACSVLERLGVEGGDIVGCVSMVEPGKLLACGGSGVVETCYLSKCRTR